MNYLLDTNVVSEPTKRQPHAQVMKWYAAQPAETLLLSVLTLGELRRGILLVDEGARRRALVRWLEVELEPAFEERILNVDGAVMRHWAELQSRCRKQGHQLSVMDGLIAATALAHGLTVVTRNTADFSKSGIPLLNPWEE